MKDTIILIAVVIAVVLIVIVIGIGVEARSNRQRACQRAGYYALMFLEWDSVLYCVKVQDGALTGVPFADVVK